MRGKYLRNLFQYFSLFLSRLVAWCSFLAQRDAATTANVPKSIEVTLEQKWLSPAKPRALIFPQHNGLCLGEPIGISVHYHRMVWVGRDVKDQLFPPPDLSGFTGTTSQKWSCVQVIERGHSIVHLQSISGFVSHPAEQIPGTTTTLVQ